MADKRTDTRTGAEEDARERAEDERLRGIAEEGDEEFDESTDDEGELDDEDDARGVI